MKPKKARSTVVTNPRASRLPRQLRKVPGAVTMTSRDVRRPADRQRAQPARLRGGPASRPTRARPLTRSSTWTPALPASA